jgi:predicted transcriptional regulator
MNKQKNTNMEPEERIIEISDEDIEYLFLIIYECFGDPETLSEKMKVSKEKVKLKLEELETKGLIKIEYKDGEIYGSMITSIGAKIYEDPKYKGIKSLWGYK